MRFQIFAAIAGAVVAGAGAASAGVAGAAPRALPAAVRSLVDSEARIVRRWLQAATAAADAGAARPRAGPVGVGGGSAAGNAAGAGAAAGASGAFGAASGAAVGAGDAAVGDAAVGASGAAGVRSKLTTPFASFASSVGTASALTLFTEFGDRTFFLAAILAMRHSRWVVFAGSVAALVVQTVLSTFAGQLFHMLPSVGAKSALLKIPVDDYAAAVLLFVFGVVHLREGFAAAGGGGAEGGGVAEDGGPAFGDAAASDLREVSPAGLGRSEAAEGGATAAAPAACESGDCSGCCSTDSTASAVEYYELADEAPLAAGATAAAGKFTAARSDGAGFGRGAGVRRRRSSLKSLASVDRNAEMVEAEKAVAQMRLGADSAVWEVFRSVFWVIFVAELGDKSMVTTVALAAAQNPYGVFVGAAASHAIVTLAAVVAGSVLQRYISERTAYFCGAALFFAFAGFTLLEGLARQGVHLWWKMTTSVGSGAAVFLGTRLFSTLQPERGGAELPFLH